MEIDMKVAREWVIAIVLLAACRSTGPAPAHVPVPGLDLKRHHLAGCKEKVRTLDPPRGPLETSLAAYQGRVPLVTLNDYIDCQMLDECQVPPPVRFVVYPDGMLVYVGPSCGRDEAVVIRRLPPQVLEAVRVHVSRCGQVEPTLHDCSHSHRLEVNCQTRSGTGRLYDTCSRAGDPVPVYVEGLRRALDLTAMVDDPQACAQEHGRGPVQRFLLTWLAPPDRWMECTYQPE